MLTEDKTLKDNYKESLDLDTIIDLNPLTLLEHHNKEYLNIIENLKQEYKQHIATFTAPKGISLSESLHRELLIETDKEDISILHSFIIKLQCWYFIHDKEDNSHKRINFGLQYSFKFSFKIEKLIES